MIDDALKAKIDRKTKPPGSLGMIEDLAFRIGKVQNNTEPRVEPGRILVFAGDHGAVASGASAYPQEVTQQMVWNILSGGAAISCFADVHGLDLKVVDAGVDASFEGDPGLISAKVERGTADYFEAPAMTKGELEACEEKGGKVVERSFEEGYRTLGFGEMGIGNSASASAIMSFLHERPLEDCVGMGAGSVGKAFEKKKALIRASLSSLPSGTEPRELLRQLGGFEIAQMQAAMRAAHRKGILILVDGFISTISWSLAYHQEPDIQRSSIFSHVSDENGHELLLRDLGVKPLLSLGMRLGEGSGAAMAFPLLRAATTFLRDMASFEEAGVSGDKNSGG